MMLFLILFMILQSAILINIYKTKDIDNIGKVDTMIILGAKVNEKHANFLVNESDATFLDMIALLELIIYEANLMK